MLPDLERRQFLGLVASGALVALQPSLLRAPVWRIGVLAPVPSARDEAARACLEGLLLGQEEAARTVRLFGRTVEFVAQDLDAGADAAQAADRMIGDGADALISVLDESRVRDVASLLAHRERMGLHLLAAGAIPPASGAAPWNLFLAARPEARAGTVLAELHRNRTALEMRGACVILADSVDDTALALRADRAASQAAGSGPLLEGIPSGTAGRADARTVFLAARAPGRVASLVASLGGAGWPGLLVDLFGTTEHLPPAELPSNVMRSDSWTPDLERFGAAQLNDRFRARFGTGAGMRGPAWAGWFAAKVLVEATLRTSAAGGSALGATVRSARFDGHQGKPLSFAADGSLAHPLHVVGTIASDL